MDAEFRRVVDAFKTKAALTANELSYFDFKGMNDVLQTLGKIQQEQSAQRRLIFMNRIRPFIKTMEEFGKIVEVFLNASEVLCFVWVGNRRCTPKLLAMLNYE